jgi:hypothetical protein
MRASGNYPFAALDNYVRLQRYFLHVSARHPICHFMTPKGPKTGLRCLFRHAGIVI